MATKEVKIIKPTVANTNVRALVDCIKVNTDVTLTIVIKGGLSFTVEIPT